MRTAAQTGALTASDNQIINQLNQQIQKAQSESGARLFPEPLLRNCTVAIQLWLCGLCWVTRSRPRQTLILFFKIK